MKQGIHRVYYVSLQNTWGLPATGVLTAVVIVGLETTIFLLIITSSAVKLTVTQGLTY